MDRLDRPDDAFRWLCEIYSAHPRPYLQTHLTKLAQVVGQEDAAVDTLLRESMHREVMQNDSLLR